MKFMENYCYWISGLIGSSQLNFLNKNYKVIGIDNNLRKYF